MIIFSVFETTSFNRNPIYYKTSNQNLDYNWIVSLTGNVTQISQNISKLDLTQNETFLEDVFFSSHTIGGQSLIIKDNKTSLFYIISPSLQQANVTQHKGSTKTVYSLIFYKPGTNISNFSGINDFLVQINGIGSYNIETSFDPNLAFFNGSIKFNFLPALEIILNPTTWVKTGLLPNPISTSSSSLTESSPFFNNSTGVAKIPNDNLIIPIFTFTIVSLIGISSIVIGFEYIKYSNLKPKRSKKGNFLKYLIIRFHNKKNRSQNITPISEHTIDIVNQIIEENKIEK